jgi:hypothetical protein
MLIIHKWKSKLGRNLAFLGSPETVSMFKKGTDVTTWKLLASLCCQSSGPAVTVNPNNCTSYRKYRTEI